MSIDFEKFKDIANNPDLSYLSEEVKKYEEDVLKQSEKELLNMLDLTRIDEWAIRITFDELNRLTFNKAHEIIKKLSIAKRIKLLKELDAKLIYLYESTKQYNDQGFGKSVSPEVFQSMMGRIKHLEILQNWLFGIE